MKKVLSLVLVIAMILSSFSFAFAAKFEDVEGDYEEAIDTLVALGVITGYEDGTFRPERIVTRAEMAKLIVEILGYGDLVSGAKSNFADTQGHWADPWIALAAGRGLVIGTGDGNFTPDRQVSYDEAITMVVRALGYTDDCNELKGMTWPTNFKVKAAELDLLNKVKLTSAGADRGGVAQLLYNALDAALVTVTVDGDVTILQDQVGTDKVDRILLTRLAKAAPNYEVGTETLDKDSKFYGGDIVDLAPYMYQTIDAYVSKTDEYVVVYVKGVKSVIVEGTVIEVDDTEDEETITVEDANEKEHVIKTDSDKIKTYFNGVEILALELEDLVDAKVTVVIDDKNENGKFDSSKDVAEAVVATLATGERKISREYVDGRLRLDTINLPEDDGEVDFDNLVIKGDATELEDIKKDSVVTLYEGKDGTTLVKLTLVVSTDTVEGRITKTNAAKDVITVDGKAYDVSKFASSNSDMKAGAEGIFFLNAEGEIFAFEKEGSGAPKNYAVVTAIADGSYVEGFGVEKEAQVKLATEAGKIVTYKVDEDAEVTGGLTDGVEFEEDLKDAVVEYDLTSDGKIDLLKVVDWDAFEEDFVPESRSFILADNAVIFDGETNVDGKFDYEVLSYEQLDEDGIVAHAIYNDDGEIELLFVIDGVVLEKTGTFAVITNVELTVNDDDEDVYLLTAWVDGVQKEYLTTKKFRTDNTTPSAFISGYALKELKLKDGEVTGILTEDGIEVTVDDVNVSAERIKVGSKWYGLADDAVIYLQTGANKVVVEDIYEIDIDDVVTLYNTNDKDDIEVVIIRQR